MLQQIRPDFIALTLIYWVVYHPRRVGFLPAWFLGLTMDVADGSLFGQHALAYAVLDVSGDPAAPAHRHVRHAAADRARGWRSCSLSQLIMLGVRMMAGADFPGVLYFRAQPRRSGAVAAPVQRDPRSAAAQRSDPGCRLSGCACGLFRRFASPRQERDPIVLGRGRRAELRDHQKELHNFQMRLAVCAGVVLFVFFCC